MFYRLRPRRINPDHENAKKRNRIIEQLGNARFELRQHQVYLEELKLKNNAEEIKIIEREIKGYMEIIDSLNNNLSFIP